MQTSPVQVQRFLKDINYPVKKHDLIEHAKKNKASKEVLQDLEKLPDKEYTNAADVSREFKGS
jgi:Protein of unknown function (DUF2795)